MTWFTYASERISYQFIPVSTHNPFPSNETVVFIHGLGLDKSSWERVLPFFHAHYSTLSYDLRGHGRSGGTTTLKSLSDLREDLNQLCIKLNINTIHIVGYGIGGTIAVWFAKAYPNKVKTITLVSTQLFYPPALEELMGLHRRSLTLQGSIEPIANHVIEGICALAGPKTKQLLKSTFLKVTPASYFRYFQLPIAEYNLLSDLPDLTVPTLQLAGERDGLNPPYFYGFGTSFFPNSRFIIVPDASNAVHLDKPDEASRLILEHMHQRFRGNTPAPTYGKLIQNAVLAGLTAEPTPLDVLRIDVLSEFKVTFDRQVIRGAWNQRRAKELLLFLVFHPVTTREEICAALWASTPIGKARSRLRVSLHHLRLILLQSKSPLEARLEVHEQSISLKGTIICDLINLSDQLMDVNHETNPELKIRTCQELLDFLKPVSLANLNYDWILDFTDRLETQICELAEWLAEHYYEADQPRTALRYYKTAVEHLSVNEVVYDRIIGIYSLLNDKPRVTLWQQRRAEMFYL